MPESLVNSRIRGERQILFIERTKVWGVQSISVEQPTTAAPISHLGIGNFSTTFAPIGEQIGSININSQLINQDYFLNYVTGNQLINGYILRNQSDITNNYSFISGYLTDYQCQYSVGEPIPQISTNIKVIGDLGKIPTGSFTAGQIADLNFIRGGNFTNNFPLIPSVGSINLNIDDFYTNRVITFGISVSANKIPIYNAGSRKPKRIDLIYPINVRCQFSFDLGDYSLPFLRSYPSNTPKQIENLNLRINDYNNGNNITNYNFSNFILTNTNYETSANGNVIISTVFEGNINRV